MANSKRFSRFSAFVVLLLAGLVSLSVTTSAVAADKGKNKADKNKTKLVKIEGRINSVNLSSGTVVLGSTTVSITAATKIERNNRHVGLGSIRVGDFGQAKLSGGKTIKLESRGP